MGFLRASAAVVSGMKVEKALPDLQLQKSQSWMKYVYG